jgi:quercetin dioxygenase-like cupin family protein
MTGDHVLGPSDGDAVDLAGVGVRFMIGGPEAGGAFALVEHPLAPRTLGSPVHTHRHEDEWSFVLEGEVGLLIGGDHVTARPGDLVRKPRGVPHAFWNATDATARLLELIAPPGFERYFAEAASMFTGEPDMDAFAALCERYGLDMDFDSAPVLCARYGLELPPEGELAG